MSFEYEIADAESWSLLRELKDNVLHAIVTDPPYGISYDAEKWDSDDSPVLQASYWAEALRVCRPGAHAVVFGFPRKTFLVMLAMAQAGWEIRQEMVWLFGKGTPKSVNVAAEMAAAGISEAEYTKWLGWGTGLTAMQESIVLARKPLDGRLVDNVVRWGCGGLNIAATAYGKLLKDYEGLGRSKDFPMKRVDQKWAATVIGAEGQDVTMSAWYCPKPSVAEKEFGLDHLPLVDVIEHREDGSAGRQNMRAGAGRLSTRHNPHKTVKPVDLMRYMVALVLPTGGVLMDPFCGSGTTGIGAFLHDPTCTFIGTDLEFADLARDRIAAWVRSGRR